MTKQKQEKKVVVLAQRETVRRERISFRDYAQDKERLELVVDFIFLPVRFRNYGLLLSDGNDEYRISYNIRPELMEQVFEVFNMKIGKDYEGKILVLKKEGQKIWIEEGKDRATYVWLSGKGWRLANLEAEDIPF